MSNILSSPNTQATVLFTNTYLNCSVSLCYIIGLGEWKEMYCETADDCHKWKKVYRVSPYQNPGA